MRICVLGCGTIGSLLTRYLALDHHVVVHDHNPPKLEVLASLSNVKIGEDLARDIKQADMVILAVKPQGLEAASAQLAPHLHTEQLVLSVLAGTTIAELERILPGPRILRMMPNTAMSVGKSVIALAANPLFTDEERQEFSRLFAGLGPVSWFPEKQFDAVTALAGSGIAFVFLMLESFTEAGIRLGLSADTALALACQTFTGAISLTEESKQHPAALKWQVCSPGGSTIAGIHELEASALRAGIMDGLLRTYERNVELGRELEKD